MTSEFDRNIKRSIIVDLDGTLCNIEHRRHHVVKEKNKDRDFPAFLKGIPKDSLNWWCWEIINSFFMEYNIILLTGREGTEQVKKDTLQWLTDNSIMYNEIYFRNEKDYREDYEIKKEIYDKHLKDKNVLFIIDDRKQVVDMWRKLGLVCLQCDEGLF